jgi:menaquinone-9 beta-reductase
MPVSNVFFHVGSCLLRSAMSIDSTITIQQASQMSWDVIVVGAGPAGSMAAIQLRKYGVNVLLADKAVHPRSKVCGCCLNGEAVELLESIGFGPRIRALNAVPTQFLSMHAGKHSADLKLRAGTVISRATLDYELIKRCIEDGVHYLSATKVNVGDLDGTEDRTVDMEKDGDVFTAAAKCVLVADGLNGHSLDALQLLPARSTESSRIGAGTRVTDFPKDIFKEGVIYMTCGRGGYVGMVVLEDGSLDVAAAFDKAFVQSCKSVGEAANALIASTKLASLNLEQLTWQGTPALTRKRSGFSAPRLFVIGDAASYAEPFTGEGIAWALLSATAVAPIVQALLADSTSNSTSNSASNSESTSALASAFDHQLWDRKHRELISGKQFFSMMVARYLRSFELVEFSIRILSLLPILAGPVIRAIGRDRRDRILKVRG